MHSSIPKYTDPGTEGEPKRNLELWEKAADDYEKKKYRDSLVATIKHVNSELLSDLDSQTDPLEVTIDHGSASVTLAIKDGRFSIRAPFLKIGTDHTVPLMRRIAEVNFRPLTLPSIGLRDDILCFEYDTALELCHPHKIMDVLVEVCIFADRFDDEFIEKYGASFLKEPE